jgi:membrane protein DedA with SNARE-associated domain
LDASATPSRRTLILLVTPIVILIAVGTVANALTPWLLKNHPLWLVALEARNRNLLAAASRVDVVPFVVFGVLRRMLSDPLFFLLGHLYGDNALRWAERRLGSNDVIVKVTEQGFRRASGAMVFLFPGALVCVLAGVSRMSVRAFLTLNLAGTVSAVIVLRLFAKVLEAPIEAVLRFNDRNVKWLTLLSVALVVTALILQRRRGEGELEAVLDIETDLAETAEEDDPEAP